MNRNLSLIPLTITVLIMAVSCGKNKKSQTDSSTPANFEQPATEVDTIVLRRQTFQRQVVCNGKLKALIKADLQFRTTGTIAQIPIHNGSTVYRGQLLASLDKADALHEYAKAKRGLEKARIDLYDKLIGQGYRADTVGVPKDVLKIARNASGYDTAVDNLAEAAKRLSETDLKAPFAGTVANLDTKVFQRTAEKFCTLIDNSYFDVEFNLLEAEMSQVKRGQRVKIQPFTLPDNEYLGEITEINPVVDDHGQIKVRAKVANRRGGLIEGMNVKIVMQSTVPHQFVVPKDAVVTRDNYNVVFRYVDGVAVWTYVDVVMSNIDSHVITGNAKKDTEICANDVIITSGNLNLANDSRVTPKKQ